MTDARAYLRAGDIARLSGASVRTVRRWIADTLLPSVKVRGMRLVPREAIERLLTPIPLNWEEPEDDDRKPGCYRNSGKLLG
jgi:excisionase family DNA binding protein